MNIFKYALCVSLPFLSATSTLTAETKTTPKLGRSKPAFDVKNVLFLFADDLGYKDLACFGSDFYETPHLDALAKSGVKMTNAYAACPVCSPTRSSVMTGQYPARTKNTDYFGAYNPAPGKKTPGRFARLPLLPASYVEQLPAELLTLPEALKQHGYSTFFAGKWHLGKKGSWPQDHGFDINKGGWTKGGPYGGKQYFSPYGNPMLEDGKDGEHLPDRLATETVKFMKQAKEPFFAMLSFYSVHTPLIGREDLVKKYQEKAKKLGLTASQIFHAEPPRNVRMKQDHAIYGAMVEAMDEAVGKVIQGLKDSGKYDETMIVFFSDNGGLSTSEGLPTSNAPFRAGKGWLYEGGIKEPTILKIPGVTLPGTESQQLMTSTDFYPTILEACGLPLKKNDHVDGISVIDLLTKNKQRTLYWHYPHWGNQGGLPGAIIREGDWKLIKHYTQKGLELYNLKSDPSETKNLAKNSPLKLKELEVKLDAWLKETDANMPTINPEFKGKLEKW